SDAIAGLGRLAAARGDHGAAADLFERLRGLGLAADKAARHELALARSLVALGRTDDARASLRRATLAGGETAAEAHAVLAEVAEASADADHAAAELDTAITSLIEIAGSERDGGDRMYTRAAELAVHRAELFDKAGQQDAASVDWQRAHELARLHSPELARGAARTLLDRAGTDASVERRWIDAVLATRPPITERAALLVRRADVRRREHTPDLAAAIADLHEAIELTEDHAEPAATDVRREAYQLEAALLAQSGDQRARAQALAALAKMAERAAERIEVETAAAAAWLAADEPAAALPHGTRAHASLESDSPDVPAALRREVLVTLGEAAWRQRAWADVIRAYRGLVSDPGAEAPRLGAFRYRLAVAADRSGDPQLAIDTLRPLVEDRDADSGIAPELRGQAMRLFADLAERAGDLEGAAGALEAFAALAIENSPRARADAMYRAGELFRRANRDDDAIRCLEVALKISDSHLPALDALETAWREKGDLERVATILGRKVAATARHPARQKSLLSRLGDLQEQLSRPDVALATHQRALEIDPQWRPSLQYVTHQLRRAGQRTKAVEGLLELVGDLPGDSALDLAIVTRDQQASVHSLAAIIPELEPDELEQVRHDALVVLERAAAPLDDPYIVSAVALLRGQPSVPLSREADTHSGRVSNPSLSALALKETAQLARDAGKLEDAFATLETANNVNPGDASVLQDLVELATTLADHDAATRHLTALAELCTGSRRGTLLLELADLFYDKLEDPSRAREAMRGAAEAFGSGARRDTTLRMLATEAASNLAWDVAVDALSAVAPDRRTQIDVGALATALQRAGRDHDAIALVEDASANHGFDDGGELLQRLRGESVRKSELAKELLERARNASAEDASAMREEARNLRDSVGDVSHASEPGVPVTRVTRPYIARIKLVPAAARVVAAAASDEAGWQSVSDPALRSPGLGTAAAEPPAPSVTIAATPAEADRAISAAAQHADRDRLIAAHRDTPDDAGVLLALLAHLQGREPELRRKILEETAVTGRGRSLAIALHELALIARESHQPTHAAALWQRAHAADASYAPVWMPLADALATADEISAARDLYEAVAASAEYDDQRRAYAAERSEALGKDHAIIVGEVTSAPAAATGELASAIQLSQAGDLQAAIAAAERAAEIADANDTAALELLEKLYFEANNVTAASEAIGRQLALAVDDAGRSALWRRRAKMYRETLGRDAEAYRCLKEAHAFAPDDAEIAYQLRTAAMVRGEWALAASLIYREIAAISDPRERGALHLELALNYLERLDDEGQAQDNFEQALALDPTIPAVKLPLARRYEHIGRYAEAARFYEEAAAS
ncbi:MAG: hypothetical protein AB7L28_26920, partial [Kofleriaceae bacterium]